MVLPKIEVLLPSGEFIAGHRVAEGHFFSVEGRLKKIQTPLHVLCMIWWELLQVALQVSGQCRPCCERDYPKIFVAPGDALDGVAVCAGRANIDAHVSEDYPDRALEDTHQVFLVKVLVERRSDKLVKGFEGHCVAVGLGRQGGLRRVGADDEELVLLVRRSVPAGHSFLVKARHFCDSFDRGRRLQIEIAVVEDSWLCGAASLLSEIIQVAAALE